MLLAEPAGRRWLRHHGELAEVIRRMDWAATPLGALESWPATLRTTVNLMLPAQAQMVLFWGPDFLALYNDAYAPTIGLKHPRALGRPASEGWSELWDDLGPLLRSVRDTGETVAATDRPFQIDRQGFLEAVWFDISYSPVRGEGGDVEGVLCIVNETTQRVRTARALADNESRLRASAERIALALNAGAVLGTWVWDVRHDRFTGDERFARTFALDPAAMGRGLKLEDVKQSIHPDDKAQVSALIAAALRDGGPYRAEYRVPREDGNWRWIEANGRVELASDGTPARFPGVLIDIDRRRAAEETLRRSEARFRALTQALPNQVWTATPDGQLDWVNRRVVEFAGLPPAQLLGDQWAGMVHPDDLPAVVPVWHASLASGQVYESEFRLRRQDGAWRWHLVRAIPLHTEGGDRPRWVGTNTDIQDHKAAQAALSDLNAALEQRVQEHTRELREAQARLHQSQKMEALGQLTGGIAHDFNNLLQGISGSVEVMRRRFRSGQLADVDRYAESAIQSTRRAAALVQRLLAFARRQSLDPQPVHVEALVASMEDLLRRTLGENIALHIRPGPGGWPARCDENQLESAILNLAINARDAMPHGGRLQISTESASLPQLPLGDGELLPAGDYAVITVADTGEGIAPDMLTRVFEPFFTTKPLGQGTGLGLSMIYGFARQSGGGVRLASTPGRGTTAALYLPRHRDARPISPTPAPAEPRGGGEVVLVVEDDASVRLLVIDVLHELGYRTIESANGDTALRFLQGDGRIDLLISDVGLPGMNGRQLAELARLARPELPVLLMTGYAAALADRSGIQAPDLQVITKPFAMAALAVKVQGMMAAASA